MIRGTPCILGYRRLAHFQKRFSTIFEKIKKCVSFLWGLWGQRLFGKCPKVLLFETKILLLLVNERPMKSKCDLVSKNKKSYMTHCAQAFDCDVLQRLFIIRMKLQSSIMSSNTFSPYHKTWHCHLSQVGRGMGDEVENKEEQDEDEETWSRSGINMLFLDQSKEGEGGWGRDRRSPQRRPGRCPWRRQTGAGRCCSRRTWR